MNTFEIYKIHINSFNDLVLELKHLDSSIFNCIMKYYITGKHHMIKSTLSLDKVDTLINIFNKYCYSYYININGNKIKFDIINE